MLNSKGIQGIYQPHNKIKEKEVIKAAAKEVSPPKKSTVINILNVVKKNAGIRRHELVKKTKLSANCIDRAIKHLIKINKMIEKEAGKSGPYTVFTYYIA